MSSSCPSKINLEILLKVLGRLLGAVHKTYLRSAVAAAATDGGRSIAAEASNRLRSAEEDAASYLRADQSATGESGAADVKDKN